MLKIVRASALVLALAAPAGAGETPNHITEVPTQPTIDSVPASSPGTDGSNSLTADSYGETLLNLLESVLALF